MDRKQKILTLSSCMDLLLIRTSQEIKLRMISDCFGVFLIFRGSAVAQTTVVASSGSHRNRP